MSFQIFDVAQNQYKNVVGICGKAVRLHLVSEP